MVTGIGIDMVNIERMDTLSPTTLRRLFHPLEVEEAMGLPEHARSEFLASRFAAKEALGKALGTGLGGIAPSDICVVKEESGAPKLSLQGRVLALVGNRSMFLSISHDRPMACAVVVLEGGL